MMPPLLQIRDLSHSLRGAGGDAVEILHGINLEMWPLLMAFLIAAAGAWVRQRIDSTIQVELATERTLVVRPRV